MTDSSESPFDSTLDVPLYKQLYVHLRTAILTGRLKRGTKLPSTRALASEWNVSRNTVLNAYQQLLAEGYLESVEASGTFVATVSPDLTPALPTSASRHQFKESAFSPPRLSRAAQTLVKTPAMPGELPARSQVYEQRAFSAGMPALDAFPFELWGKLVARQVRHITGRALMYQDTAGYRPLREAIVEHATVTRRVRCTADQIIIVSGSQGGLDLATRTLLNPGDAVWLEEPGYLGARGALLGAGAKIVPVPVDREGLNVAIGIERCSEGCLVYLTPSHQFPLGMTMSLARRLAILAWAGSSGAYILEDDYDSEYRFAGRPLAALQGLDNADCVIYIGTFSKVLFPALRLGYLILPPPLVDPFLAMRKVIDIHSPVLEQAALTDFIAEGHFGRHLRRMRTMYAERRDILLDAMADLPLEIPISETGMYCVGWLPAGIDGQIVSEKAVAHDIQVSPVSKFCMKPLARDGLLLGYAGVDERHIRDGARRLAAALEETGTMT